MREFNYNVKTFEDLQREFPDILQREFPVMTQEVCECISKFPDVKKLTKREIKRFEEDKADAIWRADWIERKLTRAEKNEIQEAAKYSSVYWYLWSLDHIDDQMLSGHQWNIPKNKKILFSRMKRDGYDIYDREKDSIYEFIQSLEGGGRVLRNINGNEFRAFNPYARKEK